MSYKEYKQLNMTQIGEEIRKYWEENETFEKGQELSEGHPSFVFYDGPPSANGKPGIHHVMARTIKDVFCRYKAQKGYHVDRKAGWDTHGLPVELGVEKTLGITKEDIGKKISVDDYNHACRTEVLKYKDLWDELTRQMGYWVDLKHPYITFENEYIETLWFLLKKLYDKGLLYKGYTIQPFSPAAGTGLSSHELNLPGCYRDVKDTTCVALFKLKELKGFDVPAADVPTYAIAWTTTPWTLPSNTALCVGPTIDYVLLDTTHPYTQEPCRIVMAKALVGSFFTEGEPEEKSKLIHATILGECKGTALEGIAYDQLIPWVKPTVVDMANQTHRTAKEGEAFRVILGDYVTTEDGTGIVHIAPTFGADDARVAKKAGIADLLLYDHDGKQAPMVDRTGKFWKIEDLDSDWVKDNVDVALYKQYAGKFVKNAYDPTKTDKDISLDVELVVMLKEQGKLFKSEKHTHSYPHCWRTDKPVLYYPLDSWFIRTTALRDRMIELNKTINWKPEATGTGRFGNWLENIVDWNLSRSRYWGTPLPIWRTEDGKEEKCIGSLKELYAEIEKAVAAGIMASNPLKDKGFDPADMSLENYNKIDLHRPYVDSLYLVSPSGKKMVRETDLIDVWFDSGAMPYAQEGLRNLASPAFGATADFIAEGVDQTRGWFYTLHAIHTMISGTPAFKRVISNGLVLDKNGNKMSKRLGNAVDPFKALDTYGADALRWYMLTNAEPWDNLKFDENGVADVRRKFFGTLYNTYAFFARYANIDGWEPEKGTSPVSELDKWILSKLNSVIRDVRAAYEDYDVKSAGRILETFVCDDVSNWYVRLNRARFWAGEMTADKQAAYQTLYQVLKTVSILGAPIAPFFMDQLYLDLTCHSEQSEDSVHFVLMPEVNAAVIDTELEERMALAQQATSLVLALRKKVNIPVRQPLQKVMIPVISEKVRSCLEAVKEIILSEVNVKEMEFIADTTGIMTLRIKPNFKVLGKTYGARMKEIAAAFGTLEQPVIAAIQKAEGAGESYTLALPGGEVVLSPGDYAISSEDMPGWLVASEGALTVALDIEVTPELRREGLARELVNRIQNLRKSSGFEVTDRIDTEVYADDPDLQDALSAFGAYVKAQTLSLSIGLHPFADAPETAAEVEWTEGTIKLTVKR